MGEVVQVTGLRKAYGDHQVIDGVDLTIDPGTIFGLLGPNGAGKTTLVRILATLLPFDAGQVRINGHDMARDAGAVRRTIGLTGQYASVDELLTGRENLLLLGRLAHLRRGAIRDRAAALLRSFDLEAAADRRVSTYSGGMRRRLDLAASLLATPPLLFLDEPTTGLDPRSRRALWEAIESLAADGTTVLLTTQYLDEADALADEIAVLHDGRIVTRGTAHQLKAQVGEERLTVRLRHAADLDAAAGLLGPAKLDPPERRLTVPLRDPKQLRTVLEVLDDAGIDLEHVQVTSPTLDDVFFAVTANRDLEVPS